MKRVVFVNPPNTGLSTADLAPPLWALILGSVAEREGADPLLLDLNLELLEDPSIEDEFYAWSTRRILDFQPDLVAFSSMAVNSHVSLQIARELKASTPNTLTILGGPHFSAIAGEVIERFPWIDFIAVGEAEESFARLLRQLTAAGHSATPPIAGFVCRSNSGTTIDGGREPPTQPDKIPSPAYHLVDLERYFRINPRRLLDIDAASRGCTFACTYCYAPTHFGQGERRPQDQRFVDEFRRAHDLGAERFFIVQDNFVNHPADTIRLCEQLAAAELGITFHCYATLAQLTPAVIKALADAGCRAVYVGVDAVHPNARRDFSKALYRNREDMLDRIDVCLESGIEPTLAFLLREPEQGRDEFEETVGTALAARLRGCPIRLNTLTIYPGTAEHHSHAYRYLPDPNTIRLTMDLPEVVLQNDFAADAPWLFPFHGTHRSSQTQASFQMGVHVLYTLVTLFPRALSKIANCHHVWDVAQAIVERLEIETFSRCPVMERRRSHAELFLKLVYSAQGDVKNGPIDFSTEPLSIVP